VHSDVVLFIMPYKVSLTFESVVNILVTVRIKAIEQYFPVVLFITLYKVQDGSNFLMKTYLKCDHSNESYRAVS